MFDGQKLMDFSAKLSFSLQKYPRITDIDFFVYLRTLMFSSHVGVIRFKKDWLVGGRGDIAVVVA
jgi:hypothetical protein